MHPFDVIEVPGKSKFLLTPCPGTKEVSVEESIRALKAEGAQVLITMMTDSEMEKYQVTHIPQIAAEEGMDWFHFPVEDDCAPSTATEKKIAGSLNLLLELMEQEKTIAMHCKGGTGRTGLISAILMLESGMALTEVTQLIQSVKPKSLTLQPHCDYLSSRYS